MMITSIIFCILSFVLGEGEDCRSRIKTDISPLWPCGNDAECFWDMGNTGSSTKCIYKDDDCTNKEHYYKDIKVGEKYDERIDTFEQLFMIDVTGSMSSAVKAAYNMSEKLAKDLKELYPTFNFLFAAVCYRDPVSVGPSEAPQWKDFSSEIGDLTKFFSRISAVGGGDWPEDVAGGLEKALSLSWGEVDETLKAITLIADAPPLGYELGYPPKNSSKYVPKQTDRFKDALKEVAKRKIGLAVVNLDTGWYNQMENAKPDILELVTDVTWYMMTASEIGKKYIEPTLSNIEETIGRYNHTCKLNECEKRQANASREWACGRQDESPICYKNGGTGSSTKPCTLACIDPLYEANQTTGTCAKKACAALSSALCATSTDCQLIEGKCKEDICASKTIGNCGNCTTTATVCEYHPCVPPKDGDNCPNGCSLNSTYYCVVNNCGKHTSKTACENEKGSTCEWETELGVGGGLCVITKCRPPTDRGCPDRNCTLYVPTGKCIRNPCKYRDAKSCVDTDCRWNLETKECEYHDCVRVYNEETCPSASAVAGTTCVKEAVNGTCKVDPCSGLADTACNTTDCFWKGGKCEYQPCVRFQPKSEPDCYGNLILKCEKTGTKCVPNICSDSTAKGEKCPRDCDDDVSQKSTCEWQPCVRQPHVDVCAGWDKKTCVLDAKEKCIEQIDCELINDEYNCLKHITCEWNYASDKCIPNKCLNCSDTTCYPISKTESNCRNDTCGDAKDVPSCVKNPLCYWDYQALTGTDFCKLNPCNKTCAEGGECELDARRICIPNSCDGLLQNICLENPNCVFITENQTCVYNPCVAATLPDGSCIYSEPCVPNTKAPFVCIPEDCEKACETRPDPCQYYDNQFDCPRECEWWPASSQCKAGPCTRFPTDPSQPNTTLPTTCPNRCVFYYGRSQLAANDENDQCVRNPCIQAKSEQTCPGDCVWDKEAVVVLEDNTTTVGECRVGPCTMLDGDQCSEECTFVTRGLVICGVGPCGSIRYCDEAPGCKANPNTTAGAKPCIDDECYDFKNRDSCKSNEKCAWIDQRCISKDICTNSTTPVGRTVTCRDGCYPDPGNPTTCVPDPCAEIDDNRLCFSDNHTVEGYICLRKENSKSELHCRSDHSCPDSDGNCPKEACRIDENGQCKPNRCAYFVLQQTCEFYPYCTWIHNYTQCDWNLCWIDLDGRQAPILAEECTNKSQGCELNTELKQCHPDNCVNQYWPGKGCEGRENSGCKVVETALFNTTCVDDPEFAQAPKKKPFPYWVILVGALAVAAVAGTVAAAGIYVWKKKRDDRVKMNIEDIGQDEMDARDQDAENENENESFVRDSSSSASASLASDSGRSGSGANAANSSSSEKERHHESSSKRSSGSKSSGSRSRKPKENKKKKKKSAGAEESKSSARTKKSRKSGSKSPSSRKGSHSPHSHSHSSKHHHHHHGSTKRSEGSSASRK